MKKIILLTLSFFTYNLVKADTIIKCMPLKNDVIEFPTVTISRKDFTDICKKNENYTINRHHVGNKTGLQDTSYKTSIVSCEMSRKKIILSNDASYLCQFYNSNFNQVDYFFAYDDSKKLTLVTNEPLIKKIGRQNLEKGLLKLYSTPDNKWKLDTKERTLRVDGYTSIDDYYINNAHIKALSH